MGNISLSLLRDCSTGENGQFELTTGQYELTEK